MKSKFAPSPVIVSRPDANGRLQVAEIINEPPRHFIDNGWETEVQKQAYPLIAIQETGEEIFAGMIFAANRNRAEIEADRWMREHPEHRSIQIETVRNFHGEY